MRDFTWSAYRDLLAAMAEGGYSVHPFREFLRLDAGPRRVILRHDVDARPENALRMAGIEHDAGVRGTYYFRTVRATFVPRVIRGIHALGHEIGYHYEDLAATGGDPERARRSFEANLRRLRELVPVETLCMHGSPLSRWDNRRMWPSREYRDYGLLGEPYLDVDFASTGYLTDTGRRWDGEAYSVRDRAGPARLRPLRTTAEVAGAFRRAELPAATMVTVHPQRWHDALAPWLGELVGQGLKNQAKRVLKRTRAEAAA